MVIVSFEECLLVEIGLPIVNGKNGGLETYADSNT